MTEDDYDDYWDIIDTTESSGLDEEDLLEELAADYYDDSLAYE